MKLNYKIKNDALTLLLIFLFMPTHVFAVSEKENTYYEDILRLNEAYWQEQNRQGFDLLKARTQAQLKQKKQAIEENLQKSQEAYVTQLKSVIANPGDLNLKLKAEIELTRFFLYKMNDVQRASSVLDVAKPVRGNSLSVQLFMLKGDVALKRGDLNEAQGFFQSSLGHVDALDQNTRGFILLNLGDISFKKFEYESAIKHYERVIALKYDWESPSSRAAIQFAHARLVSSYFKLGEYEQVVRSADLMFRDVSSPGSQENAIAQDACGVVSAALFELNKVEESILLLENKSELSRCSVVKFTDMLNRGGRRNEVDALATRFEPYFRNSNYKVAFYKTWLDSLSSDVKSDRWIAVGQIAARALNRNSFGTQAHINEPKERVRSEFVVNLTDELSTELFRRGKNFSDAKDFARCEDVYMVRSYENTQMSVEARLQRLECQIGIRDYKNAWLGAEHLRKTQKNKGSNACSV